MFLPPSLFSHAFFSCFHRVSITPWSPHLNCPVALNSDMALTYTFYPRFLRLDGSVSSVSAETNNANSGWEHLRILERQRLRVFRRWEGNVHFFLTQWQLQRRSLSFAPMNYGSSHHVWGGKKCALIITQPCRFSSHLVAGWWKCLKSFFPLRPLLLSGFNAAFQLMVRPRRFFCS